MKVLRILTAYISVLLCLLAGSGCKSQSPDPRKTLLRNQQLQIADSTQARLTMDIAGPPFRLYDTAIFSAIKQRWYALTAGVERPEHTGKVVLAFHLKANGSVSDLAIQKNEVGELAAQLSQQAVQEVAPFAKWSSEMRKIVGQDYRDIVLTFYYE